MKRLLIGIFASYGLLLPRVTTANVDDDCSAVEAHGAESVASLDDAEAPADHVPDEAETPAGDPYATSAFDCGARPASAGYEFEAAYEADQDEPYTGPFSQGSLGVGIVLGSASYGESDYVILGAGVSYFVFDGLSLGLDADIWLGDDPSVYTLTPQARYVLYFVPVLKPYLGAFYRRYFIEAPFDDLNSVGGRAGAYIVTGGGGYLGLGAVYEKFLSCDETVWECDGWYPEITIGFSF